MELREHRAAKAAGSTKIAIPSAFARAARALARERTVISRPVEWDTHLADRGSLRSQR